MHRSVDLAGDELCAKALSELDNGSGSLPKCDMAEFKMRDD